VPAGCRSAEGTLSYAEPGLEPALRRGGTEDDGEGKADVTTTRPIPVGEAFDLSGSVVGLERSAGRAVLVARTRWDRPWRIDGYTVGSALAGPPPHGGERHPDADELLCLLSGRIRVRLELMTGDLEASVGPGQALAVPRGTWHQIVVDEPGQLLNITPGPRGDSRPLRRLGHTARAAGPGGQRSRAPSAGLRTAAVRGPSRRLPGWVKPPRHRSCSP
jgi:mannose-6-phosphate isomerase-like protein (cupin superfamily)